MECKTFGWQVGNNDQTLKKNKLCAPKCCGTSCLFRSGMCFSVFLGTRSLWDISLKGVFGVGCKLCFKGDKGWLAVD